jgi:bifunctional non-homologous end joining protein LigD
MKLEGIIAKRKDARYVSARTETWLKLKCLERQEFVIVGFTDRSGAKGEVGGLLLGYHEGGKLHYAGNVGTGWDAKSGEDLHKQLVKIEVDQPPRANNVETEILHSSQLWWAWKECGCRWSSI